MSFKFRIGKYESVEELQESLRALARDLEKRASALDKEPTSLEETVICKYIQLRSTAKVAEYFKAQGIRSPRGTVFSAKDVSEIIKTGGENINKNLLLMAREIFDGNTEAVIRAYG